MSDLISREAAIGVVSERCGICIQRIVDLPSAQPVIRTQMSSADCISRQAAVELIERMKLYHQDADDIAEMIANMPSAQPEPQWIPCSERLPEEDHETGMGVQYSDYVLMTVFNEEDDETVIDYGYLRDGEWYSVNADILVPNWWTVTAWMPLPESYRGDEQNGTD